MVSLYHYNESEFTECEFKLISYEKFSPLVTSLIAYVYYVSAFLAFTGNVIVIIVELFGKLTNYNFRKFLINLAIVDILTSVFCVPFSYSSYLKSRWVFPHFLCSVVPFFSLLSVFVNTLTLTVISIERYLVVIHPLDQENIINKHGNKILTFIWIIGSLYAYYGSKDFSTHSFIPPKLYNPSEDQIPINATWYVCKSRNLLWNSKTYMTINFVVTFMTPLIIITVCYLLIARKLISVRSAERDRPLRRSGGNNDTSKIIKMMCAVIVLFVICWTPIKTNQLIGAYFPELFQICSMVSYYWITITTVALLWLAMAHSFVNPIIYSFMSKSFRKDFYDLSRDLSSRIGHSFSKTEETEL